MNKPETMSPYKAAVAAHIKSLLASGKTQRDVAELLQFENPNNVSMLLSDRYPKYVLSPLKLRLLQKACQLPSAQAYALFRCLTSGPTATAKVMNLDLETLDWLATTILQGHSATTTQGAIHA